VSLVPGEWTLYGATGVTGGLIAETAVRRGHRPILAGRNANRLRSLADRLGLLWHAVDLHDPVALRQLVGSTPATLLAASPFHLNSRPVLDACLHTGSHYLDLANEIPVLEAAYSRDARARDRGVTRL